MTGNCPRLLVYADEDYLIPIIIDEDGKLCRYEASDGSSNRLWLYFHSSPCGIYYDKAFKNRALCNENGFYCNIWKALENGDQAIIGNDSLPFWNLLLLSAFLKELHEFWNRSTSTELTKIPTVFLFADSQIITEDAKRIFIEKMDLEGFSPISYSVNPNIPVCHFLREENSSFKPSYADNILFLNSVGETLRFSSAIFDGDSFLSDGKTMRVENFGEAPLKSAIVRYVVDAIDRARGGILVTEQKKEDEYRFQMRNADKWFNIRRDGNGDFDVEDFRFSFDPESQSPSSVLVKGSFLEMVQENTVRDAIEKINLYIYQVLRKKPSFVVFCGQAFEDDTFTARILGKLEITDKIILTPYTFSKALFRYFDIFPDKQERIEDFKKIFNSIRRENSGVSEWIANAGKIVAVENDMERGIKELEASLRLDRICFDEMMDRCAENLQKSRFDEARRALSLYELPSEKLTAAKKEALSFKNRSADMAPVFEKIEVVGKARDKVLSIHRLEDSIQSLSVQADDFKNKLSERMERISALEEKYPEYLALKQKFGRERDFRTRKSLLEQMSSITEEKLPEVTLPHVTAQLSASIEVSGGFFKKVRTLKFSVTIPSQEQLPCDAELHVATRSLTSVEDRMCWSFEIPKGTTGTVSGELKLPHQFVEPKKTIYLYLFPNEDVVDKNAVKADFIYVKQ